VVELLCDGDTPDTPENRITKAAKVQAAADHYVDMYREVIGLGESRHFPPYLHIVNCHLADFIINLGTDMKHYSGQGLEHLQKIGKACKHNGRREGTVDKDGIPQGVGMMRQMLGDETLKRSVGEDDTELPPGLGMHMGIKPREVVTTGTDAEGSSRAKPRQRRARSAER
jgi:hypothetical protein